MTAAPTVHHCGNLGDYRQRDELRPFTANVEPRRSEHTAMLRPRRNPIPRGSNFGEQTLGAALRAQHTDVADIGIEQLAEILPVALVAVRHDDRGGAISARHDLDEGFPAGAFDQRRVWKASRNTQLGRLGAKHRAEPSKT